MICIRTVYGGVHHTPLGRIFLFHARYLHSWKNSVGPQKVGFGNIPPRAFRIRIARYWHPLGCGAIELGKQPQGCVVVWFTPPYTVPCWQLLVQHGVYIGKTEKYIWFILRITIRKYFRLAHKRKLNYPGLYSK